MGLPNGASIHEFFCALKAGIKAAVESDLQLNARRLNGSQRPIHARQIQMNGFFAEDMLACGRGLFDKVGVGVGAGADHHGLDVRVLENGAGIGVGVGDVEVGGGFLRSLFENVGYGQQPSAGEAMGQMFCMQTPDPTCTNEAERDGFGHDDLRVCTFCAQRWCGCVAMGLQVVGRQRPELITLLISPSATYHLPPAIVFPCFAMAWLLDDSLAPPASCALPLGSHHDLAVAAFGGLGDGVDSVIQFVACRDDRAQIQAT